MSEMTEIRRQKRKGLVASGFKRLQVYIPADAVSDLEWLRDTFMGVKGQGMIVADAIEAYADMVEKKVKLGEKK